MSAVAAIAVAVTFVWAGMVLAISFLETPLKFKAPGVTLKVGLGIGKVVFGALNRVEAVLAVALAAMIVVEMPSPVVSVLAVVAIAAFVVQVAVVRPWMRRRTNQALSGQRTKRSRRHLVFVGFEVLKVIALCVAGFAFQLTT